MYTLLPQHAIFFERLLPCLAAPHIDARAAAAEGNNEGNADSAPDPAEQATVVIPKPIQDLITGLLHQALLFDQSRFWQRHLMTSLRILQSCLARCIPAHVHSGYTAHNQI